MPVDKFEQLFVGDGQLSKHYDMIEHGIKLTSLREVLENKDKTWWPCPACEEEFGTINLVPMTKELTYIVAAGKSAAESKKYEIGELVDNGQRFVDNSVCMWKEITKAQQFFRNGGDPFHTGLGTALCSMENH